MKLIDLSHPLTNQMLVWEGDPEVKVSQVAFHLTDHYCNFKLECGMHSSTHIDGPKHFFKNAEDLSHVSIDNFVGDGIIINTKINNTDLIINQLQNRDLTGKIIVIYTGHYQHFNTPIYYNTYPTLDFKLGKILCNHQPKMIALDTPSPDTAPYTLHQLFLSNNILIAENLTNLEPLLFCKKFEIIALPLKTETDSAPARIIARIID